MSTPRSFFALAVGVLAVSLLSGCSLVTPGAKNPVVPPAAGGVSGAPSAPSAASHQQKLTAVPSTCPSTDEVSISVHVSLPISYPQSIGDGLSCTYADSSGDKTHGLELLFGSTAGVTVDEWAAKVKGASPAAIAVPGVGDGAFYGVVSGVGTMNFYSGAVAGYVYAPLPLGSQANLTSLLADQIFVPD